MQKTTSTKGDLNHWHDVTPIKSGWTTDQKYKVTDAEGRAFFLRRTSAERLYDLKEEALLISAFRSKGLPVAEVEAVGLSQNGEHSYLLLHWLEGLTLDSVLSTMTESEQYRIGCIAGRQLKRLHDTPLDIEAFSHRNLKAKKERELNAYLTSDVREQDDQQIVAFIQQNMEMIGKGPKVLEHSDYHPGNLILTPQGDLAIIDFNGSHPGDAYEEFYKLELFVIEQSEQFCIGQIHGYFNGDPPQAFWQAHSVYTAHAALYGLKWAKDHGSETDKDLERIRLKRIFNHYDRFRQYIPKWYRSFDSNNN